MMHERDYGPNNGYLAGIHHVIGSNPRSDIGVNTSLYVAAHLKRMLMRWDHKNIILQHCF